MGSVGCVSATGPAVSALLSSCGDEGNVEGNVEVDDEGHDERDDEPIPVFLLDDHEIVRRGVRVLLEATGAIAVVGEAGSVEEARRRIPAVRSRVAVLDVRLPDGNGVEVCREIRSAPSGIQCLMLTSYSDDEALLGVTRSGATDSRWALGNPESPWDPA